MVEPTHLKNITVVKLDDFPQLGMNIKNVCVATSQLVSAAEELSEQPMERGEKRGVVETLISKHYLHSFFRGRFGQG